jgi:DNA-directed RNA polymerase specialized sigma24 family protein
MSNQGYEDQGNTISTVDQTGRTIVPEVLLAAQSIRQRAMRFVEKELGDPAIAASLLEECAADVSRALYGSKGRGPDATPVGNLAGYLFRSIVRKVDRRKLKELPVAFSSERLVHLQSFNPARRLERRLLTIELLARCDNFTRQAFEWRRRGYTWQEISKAYHISAHSAESRYSQGLQKLRKEMQTIRQSSNPTCLVASIRRTSVNGKNNERAWRGPGKDQNLRKFPPSRIECSEQMATTGLEDGRAYGQLESEAQSISRVS